MDQEVFLILKKCTYRQIFFSVATKSWNFWKLTSTQNNINIKSFTIWVFSRTQWNYSVEIFVWILHLCIFARNALWWLLQFVGIVLLPICSSRFTSFWISAKSNCLFRVTLLSIYFQWKLQWSLNYCSPFCTISSLCTWYDFE